METSTGLTPTALTRTTTWPGPALGSGTSSSFRTSGPPYWWMRIAFISESFRAVGIIEPGGSHWHNHQYEQTDDRGPGARLLLARSDPAAAEDGAGSVDRVGRADQA